MAAEQTHTIECSLHLEPIADILETQAADCSCYTAEQCQGWHFSLSEKLASKIKFIIVNSEPVFGEWGEWTSCSVTCGNGVRTRNRQCTSSCPYVEENNLNHRLLDNENCREMSASCSELLILSLLFEALGKIP